jgi:hypothetical protein
MRVKLHVAKIVGKTGSRLRSLSAADQVGGKGAMDGADRLKGRPGVSKQDVCERRAKPAAPVSG